MSLGARLRAWVLSRHRAIDIAPPAHFSPTARIDLKADGYALAGSVKIGPNARISDGAILAPYGGDIRIGARVFIGPYSLLYGQGGLDIGDDVMIASHVSIVPSHHGIETRDIPINRQPITQRGVTIANNVWIGTGVRILDGVRIGEGAVVAAGAVVNRSIPDFSVAAGVPARVLKTRS